MANPKKQQPPLRYVCQSKNKKTFEIPMPSNDFCRQVDTAAKFVQDIIDKAKTEAAKKLNSEQIVSTSIFAIQKKQKAQKYIQGPG